MLSICYQDEYLVAVHKPAGMLVHRSWLDRHETRFLMQTLRDQLGCHVYPLHRLDRPTSGLVLFALSAEVARLGANLFSDRQVSKRYLALVRGYVDGEGIIDYPLKEELDKIADAQADQDKAAQPAVTRYRCLQQGELPFAVGRYPTSRYSLVELFPETGRKHQLRRHMAHLRHPIVGDTTHGDGRHNRFFREQFGIHRLLLTATGLSFIHPVTRQPVVVRTQLDKHWHALPEALRYVDSSEQIRLYGN